VLTRAEIGTLEAVADTFVPFLRAEPGDDVDLFSLSSSALELRDLLVGAIGRLDEGVQDRLRLLLRMMEQRAFPPLFGGEPRPFSAQPRERRERVLLAMSNSSLPTIRAGFQGLKRLSTFLFYAAIPDDRPNPTWESIGYRPPGGFPAAEATLRLSHVRKDTFLDCDVCIVGSGAGGGVVAAELARAGRRVLVLEAGEGLQAPDFDQRELPGMQRLYLESGLSSTRDLGLSILAGGALGGGTTVNWQTCLRTPDDVRDEWADRSGCDLFREASFSRSLDLVSERIGVGIRESLLNPNNDVLRRGCEELGYAWETIHRNARGCDPEQCGYCSFGCRSGGKQSTPRTFLHDAQVTGETEIVPNCRADRLVLERGRATGVQALATDPVTGAEWRVRVRAKTVVVAGGGIGTPVLLIRSGLRHAALGRHLMLHPTAAVGGEFTEAIGAWNGPPQTVVCTEFSRLDGGYGFRLETVPAHPGLMSLALPWDGARDHRVRMQRYSHISSIIVLVRDRLGGRVEVSRSGRPIIDYRPGLAEREYLRRGIAAAVRVHLAAGALEVSTLHSRPRRIARGGTREAIESFCREIECAAVDRNRSALFSAHQMGSCRMGTDPRRSVCGPMGEVHGVRGLFVADASLFPGSSGVNPMITIMALAHHVATGLRER
jgi:choline dehydrogenase-like flavoprotein